MANEPLAGKRFVKITDEKKRKNRAEFVKKIADIHYPKAKKIRLVMDNYGTHKASALYETFEPQEAKRIWDRFEFICTSKHGSWLNLAEIELHVLMGQCFNRRIDEIAVMKSEAAAWQKHRNNKCQLLTGNLKTSKQKLNSKNFIRQLMFDMTLVHRFSSGLNLQEIMALPFAKYTFKIPSMGYWQY